MGTRGLYGFRKNGVDKTTYNHFDSYPDYLGAAVAKFCLTTSEEVMNDMFDNIEMVSEWSKPTAKQIAFCSRYCIPDTAVSRQTDNDWYCLLRNMQGNLEALKSVVHQEGRAYMIDNHDFILDSLFCEYAYIINLDDRTLEIYAGFQKLPDEGNRYGTKNTDGYYPCKLVGTIPFDKLRQYSEREIVEYMNKCTEG